MLVFWFIILLLTIIAVGFIFVPLRKHNRLLAALFLIGFPIIAISLYLKWGSSDQLMNYTLMQSHQAEINAVLSQLNTPEKVIASLRLKLKQDPSSARGWYLLGKLYLDLQKYQDAEQALVRAYKLEATNPEIMFAYAQVLFFTHQKTLTPLAKQLLNKLLIQQPNDINALNLLAIDAYLHHDYQTAIDYWEKILPQFSSESEDAKQLLSMIAKAQQMLLHR